ncbi:hypothetical protein GT360_21730 [Vibrio astriarenae]|uniref:Protein BatD n=1 Tax=Vibrio astriarenae TaxID=1481923 RepID=A0A7Z2T8C0_9VIBR|nr:BatD family protein [Vibrio astriarenae]QIA66113.1 hypothetical protein GT360_21730 [Vibrio astriarenae]
MRIFKNFLLWGLSFALSFSSFAGSGDLAPTSQKHPEIEIRSWLKTEGQSDHDNSQTLDVAQKQQVIMVIEVATPRWFTGGTQIELPEVSNAIIMQRNQFATNLTERRNGQTWAKQRWELTIYPINSGQVSIPPTKVDVAFSSSEGGSRYATLYAAPQLFAVHLPSPRLTQTSNWFSASNATIEQDWQITYQDSETKRFKVGDSVTRTLTLKAENSLSVLLPSVLPTHSTKAFQRYITTNQLDDAQMRGRYYSTRTEQQTYLLQQGGKIVLPEYRVQWWNTQTGELESMVIAGLSLEVSHTFTSFLSAYWQIIAMTGLILGALILLILTSYRYYQTHPLPTWVEFALAITRKQSQQIRKILYVRARLNHDSDTLKQVSTEQTWQTESEAIQTKDIAAVVAKSAWLKTQETKAKKSRFTRVIPKALPSLEKRY